MIINTNVTALNAQRNLGITAGKMSKALEQLSSGMRINRAADEAIKRYPYIDASRQAAGGASYGGHLANWLEATTTRYKAIVSHAGLSSLQTQWGTSDAIHDRELMMGGPFWENSARRDDRTAQDASSPHGLASPRGIDSR